MVEPDGAILPNCGLSWEEARQLAGAFLAGFHSLETRGGYRSDLRCWFDFCPTRDLHPFRETRRIHLGLYSRDPPRVEGQAALIDDSLMRLKGALSGGRSRRR